MGIDQLLYAGAARIYERRNLAAGLSMRERMIEEMRDGVQFTRDDVTSMLAVSKNAHTEKKKASANVGTVVHYYAQHHAKISSIEDAEGFEDLDEPDQEKARNGADAFDKWYEDLGCEFVQSEFLIYSKKQRFVGRVDELIKTKNGLELIDYKTSKGVYTTQVYQVTSYLKAKEEEEGIRIAGARLVHLIKDDIYDKDGNLIKKAGSFDEVYLSRKDLVDAYVVFKALKTVAERDPIIKKIIDKQKHERK